MDRRTDGQKLDDIKHDVMKLYVKKINVLKQTWPKCGHRATCSLQNFFAAFGLRGAQIF
jgi:hypothetical protein